MSGNSIGFGEEIKKFCKKSYLSHDFLEHWGEIFKTVVELA